MSAATLNSAVRLQDTSEFRRSAVALPKAPVRSRRSFALRAAAVFGAVLIAAWLQPWKLWPTRPVHAAVESHAVAKQVSVAVPQRATTANVVLPATIRPWQTTTLHARVSGYLTAWYKELGATVKAGELLAEIETPELDQELAEGVALAAEAHAAAVQAQAERQEAEADLNVAEAQLARTQAEADLAVSQLARRESLVASSAISQEEYDTYQKQVVARTADVAAAKADVARRRTNLNTRAAVITAREATAKSRQANVERLKELQAFKRIVAPLDGVVTSRTAEVGMLVTAGKESLFTVEDMSRVRVQVNVPQAYSVQAGVGAAALVNVPEAGAAATSGTITRTSESVDVASRTMLAEIELDNTSRRFQPGSYAQVTITASQNRSAWTIPTSTLQMRVEGPHVAVVDGQNQVAIRRVQLGRDLGDRIVVVEGIHGDERLVVNPGDELRSGIAVQVIDRASPPAAAGRETVEAGE